MPATTMKTVIIHCVAGAERARPSVARGEKPPVGIVANAWRQRRRGSSRRRGRSSRRAPGARRAPPSERRRAARAAARCGGSTRRARSISGPGSSDSNSWRPPIRSRGRTASASTMIPMPPSHWVNWRQMSIERGRALDVGQHARARRREAGHRLEVGVHGAAQLRLAGQAGTAARRRRRRASHVERHDEEALARADALLARA